MTTRTQAPPCQGARNANFRGQGDCNTFVEAVQAFAAELEHRGFGPVAVIPDGRIHRFKTPEDEGKKASAWYVFHPDGVPAGAFGSWRDGEAHRWRAGADVPRPDADARRAAREAADRRHQEDALRAAEAREQDRAAWDSADGDAATHPYVMRKNLLALQLRRAGDALLVPLRCPTTGELVHVQKILPDGTKLFTRGAHPRGLTFLAGEPGPAPATVIICEGAATGLSLFEATTYPVFCALSAGNLLPVCKAVRARFPAARLVLGGDDDAFDHNGTPRPLEKNVGIRAAVLAARESNGVAVFPPVERGETDWNDYFCRVGKSATREEILRQLKEGPPPRAVPVPAPPPKPYPGGSVFSIFRSWRRG